MSKSKHIRIEFAGWDIGVNVRLSATGEKKWTATYEASSPGHLPLSGELTTEFDDSDPALDRALGDAIRAVNEYLSAR